MRLVRGQDLSDAQARALAQQWVEVLGRHYPQWTFDEALQELRNGEGLPQTVCLLTDDAQVVGSASLLADDEVSGYESVTPWLGNVFVYPEYRHRGAGAALVGAVLDLAWAQGVDEVHLVTDGAAPWYHRIGWQSIEDVQVHEHRMHCMRIPSPR